MLPDILIAGSLRKKYAHREVCAKVAKENGTLVAGGITQTKAYTYQEVA